MPLGSGSKPVFNSQALDPLKLANVIRNKNGIDGENLGRNQKVVPPDHGTGFLQLRADSSIVR